MGFYKGKQQIHDDVIKWKHFPHDWPFVRGIRRSPEDFPHKRLWRGALMFFLICAWTNGGANNRDAGDLRRHRAYHDVTVMTCLTRDKFDVTLTRIKIKRLQFFMEKGCSYHKGNFLFYMLRICHSLQVNLYSVGGLASMIDGHFLLVNIARRLPLFWLPNTAII